MKKDEKNKCWVCSKLHTSVTILSYHIINPAVNSALAEATIANNSWHILTGLQLANIYSIPQ